MFETRSHSWREAGLIGELGAGVARRARIEGLALLAAFIAVVIVYHHRADLLGIGKHTTAAVRTLVDVGVVVALLVLGWAIARDAGRALRPIFFRRMEPATAGTAGFLIRLATLIAAFFIALQVAGIEARTLALGSAITAVIIGLAAQQTFGNLIAGMVLLSARPFRVGDRVRLLGGPVGGQVDGVVSSLGLLYTTFVAEGDSVLVPNSAVLSAAVSVQEAGVAPVASGPPREDQERSAEQARTR